jgi:hypothetical protein
MDNDTKMQNLQKKLRETDVASPEYDRTLREIWKLAEDPRALKNTRPRGEGSEKR